jgi:hypothetical protein
MCVCGFFGARPGCLSLSLPWTNLVMTAAAAASCNGWNRASKVYYIDDSPSTQHRQPFPFRPLCRHTFNFFFFFLILFIFKNYLMCDQIQPE